ncbi:MAG: tRNA (adenosine(37)-N6)-dimethylallyltransferase MiaA [Lachnospiraceae bacterium]|nr:tRNA (adenosine(37)-N6)-dimethylallyltransferase MiaA [Lachnospiraceae bacterium]
MSEKPAVIVLTGPTAVGKTALSLRLAETLDGEIVGADSMQVYRGMDVGTAKATPEERARVPHHLIDVADPSQDFSVAEYVPLAEAALRDILSRGRLPLICGGTGFYIQALLKGLDFSEERESSLRERLRERMEQEGPEALHRELAAVDPAAAAAIHPNNRKRVIRALEYYQETGRRISDLNQAQQTQESPYRVLYLVLDLPREQLYRRIDQRVDQMLAQGLEEEVRSLLAQGVPAGSTAMQALGYKEMREYLEGRCTREEAADRIKLGSRHYAKRQLTWFRREKEAVWIDKSRYDNEEELFRAVLALCRKHIG